MRDSLAFVVTALVLFGCADGGENGAGSLAGGGVGAPNVTGGTGATGGTGVSGGTGVAGTGGVGASGTNGAAAVGGMAALGGTGGVGGTGGTEGAGDGGVGGDAGTGDAGVGCVACGTHRSACWPMPNTVASGLPNPAHYTDLGDGTVRDDVTCLVWQKAVAAESFTVDEARAHCASQGAGFRVATRIEIASIEDVSQPGAKVDPGAFPGTPGAFFKTGSEWVLTTKQIGAGQGTDFGWAYNLSDGIVSNARSAAIADRAWCVKGGGDDDLDAAPGEIAVLPPDRYEMAATGEVLDRYTGLVWQQGGSDAQMPWSDAAAYCSSLALNGHTFRLPSLRELATLVDESRVAPAIDITWFPDTKYGSAGQNWYWAAEAKVGSATAAWAINFDDGFTGANDTTNMSAWNYFTDVWVRCVR